MCGKALPPQDGWKGSQGEWEGSFPKVGGKAPIPVGKASLSQVPFPLGRGFPTRLGEGALEREARSPSTLGRGAFPPPLGPSGSHIYSLPGGLKYERPKIEVATDLVPLLSAMKGSGTVLVKARFS